MRIFQTSWTVRWLAALGCSPPEVCEYEGRPLTALLPWLISAPMKSSGVLGTTSAQQMMPMKNVDKMQESAGLAEQKLLEEQLAYDGAEIAGQQPLPLVNSPHMIPGEPVFISPATVAPTTASSIAEQARLHILERTHDLVALHALRLSNTGADSLRTVVEPGSGIRLLLELRQNLSCIEARAILLRGDFGFLNQHWTELKKRLESRGVHIGSLRSSIQAGTGAQSQEHGTPQNKNESSKSGFAESGFGGSMTEAPAKQRARAKTHRDWENWS